MKVVQIRDYQPAVAAYAVRHEAPAIVIILPVVRFERFEGRPRRRPSLPHLLTLKQKMDALRALKAAERVD